jgi:hypothetical protein
MKVESDLGIYLNQFKQLVLGLIGLIPAQLSPVSSRKSE